MVFYRYYKHKELISEFQKNESLVIQTYTPNEYSVKLSYYLLKIQLTKGKIECKPLK